MIKRLFIKNIALIDEMEVLWGKGFNVLTGETGAGKSITIEALLLILGEKASVDWIREGQERGMVEATFELKKQDQVDQLLSEQGIEKDGSHLIIRRELSSDGKSRAFINGSQVTVSFLKALGENLIDLHGQHEHQSLLKPENQMEFLDLFADTILLREEVGKDYLRLQEMIRKREALFASVENREKELDFLRFQEKEIAQLNFQEGEEEKLEEQQKVLSNCEKVRDILRKTEEIFIESQPSLLDYLSQFKMNISSFAQIDSSFQEKVSILEGIKCQLEDLYSQIKERFRNVDNEPEKLRWIEERMLEIRRLKKRYGEPLSEILMRIRGKISELDRSDEYLKEIDEEIQRISDLYDQKAKKLSKHRQIAGKKLAKRVEKDLEELGLKSSVFEVRIEESSRGPFGKDHVLFYISTNAGQSPKALQDVVSGGELSRIMLAIKTLLSEKEFIPILIFDEIDVNLGGQTAHKVALKLKDVSKNHQIVVITHLAQIAAYADHHYYVEKTETAKKVVTRIKRLDAQERPQEIARMIGGEKDSKGALLHAKELIEAGRNSS